MACVFVAVVSGQVSYPNKNLNHSQLYRAVQLIILHFVYFCIKLNPMLN